MNIKVLATIVTASTLGLASAAFAQTAQVAGTTAFTIRGNSVNQVTAAAAVGADNAYADSTVSVDGTALTSRALGSATTITSASANGQLDGGSVIFNNNTGFEDGQIDLLSVDGIGSVVDDNDDADVAFGGAPAAQVAGSTSIQLNGIEVTAATASAAVGADNAIAEATADDTNGIASRALGSATNVSSVSATGQLDGESVPLNNATSLEGDVDLLSVGGVDVVNTTPTPPSTR